jgi:hypothetical protein
MITRFAQVMTQAEVLEKAANHVWNRAVNSLRDSLNVALGSGSDAESAMTCNSPRPALGLSYARGIATEQALRTLTSLWRCS